MRARLTAPLAIALAALVAVSAAGTAPSGSGGPAPELQASGSRELRLTLTDSYVGREGLGLVPEADAPRGASPSSSRSSRLLDTLWIFDADFSDLAGDNAGWTSFDQSGTVGQLNHWHKDTIRINGFAWLGDSTWWCGTYDPCWRQPRGYGNDWEQHLWRDFPLSTWSAPGDTVVLAFDQRYAMERHYDFGHVDVSIDDGLSWSTIATYSNGGFQGAGQPRDWDHAEMGHQALDLSAYAGSDLRLRFRFESDEAYSSQDQPDYWPHSVRDGAWQLDNVEWKVNGGRVWLDDCEFPGDNGWVHEDRPASGQTGVTFFRGQYRIDFCTGRMITCDDPPIGTWMFAAVDTATSRMVDDQQSWFLSPPIDIAGANALIGQWHAWVDFPRPTNDIFNLALAVTDEFGCPNDPPAGFVDEDPGWWYGGPFWGTWTDDWSGFTGNDWLRILWQAVNDEPPEPGVQHRAGLFLNRQRVGIPAGEPGTQWEIDTWNVFHDWFEDYVGHAFQETARVRIVDPDGIVAARLLATNDGGATWDAYECLPEGGDSEWWRVPPPTNQMVPRSEIRYYYEATDGVGTVSTFPKDAPASTMEFSILPILGTVDDPAVLLVDGYGRRTPGEDRRFRHSSKYYYEEALEVLGFEHDTFDAGIWVWFSENVKGPDTSGMKYYDTQIWFFNESEEYALHRDQQADLVHWLGQAADGKERNLLLTGNNINWWLAAAGHETLNFLSVWMATEFVADTIEDTLPVVREAAGGFDFMTYDDAQCTLAGGCPRIEEFDEIQPTGATGSEVAAEYVTADRSILPAGVAYTHAMSGYQTVNLAFGIEHMVDGLLPNGHYVTGIADRVDLLGNIMEYFGKEPTTPGTDAPNAAPLTTRLGSAYPNPFNPSVTISYRVATRCELSLRIQNLAGQIVKFLVNGAAAPGEHEIVWDGTSDAGGRVASGVYFVRLEAADSAGPVRAETKIVLLK